MAKYYWSKFNYLFPSVKNGLLLYNSLSGCFWQLDKLAEENLKNIRASIECGNYSDSASEIHKDLIEAGIISVDTHEDILNKLEFERKVKCFNYYERSLVILPTTACNFDCSYCYEEYRPNLHMTDQVEDAIFERYFSDLNKSIIYNITWYGGEPLIGFSRMVKITNRLKQSNVKFGATIITNGYLLTEEVIAKLEFLQIKVIQITLDGDKIFHDKRRCLLNGGGTYDRILINLKILHVYCAEHELNVNIRVNIDKQNEGQYIPFLSKLETIFPRFRIYAGIVTNHEDCNAGCLTSENKIDLIAKGVKIGKELLPIMPDSGRNALCMASAFFSEIVGPQGEVYKCLNDIGKKHMVIDSVINNRYSDSKVLSRYLVGTDPYKNKNCLECFHLPSCNGGCPNEQYITTYEGAKISPCSYFKNNMDELLELQYEQFLTAQYDDTKQNFTLENDK